MSPENRFKRIDGKEIESWRKKEKNKKPGTSRRSFIKGALAMGAIAAGGKVAQEIISSEEKKEALTKQEEAILETKRKEQEEIEKIRNQIKKDSGMQEDGEVESDMTEIGREETGKDEDEEVFDTPDIEKQNLDYGSIEEMCKLKVDEKTNFNQEELIRFYQKHYLSRGKRDILDGFVRMKEIVDVEELKNIFREEGVPEDLVYLSMGETYWNPRKVVSNKNAVGYFQFLKGTGKQYGLKINSFADERKDPLLAGRACAKYLRDMYERYDKDWKLALNRYNSSYPKRYREYAKKTNEKMTYEKFLDFMESRFDMNKMVIREEGDYFNHKVKRNDTLSRIAKKYKVSLNELVSANPGTNKKSVIRLGQKLRLPSKKHVKDLVSKEKFREWAYKEAIGYTPKIMAIISFSKNEDFLAQVEKKLNKRMA